MTGEELIPTEESPEDPGTNEVDLLAVEAKIADPPIVEDHEKIINEVLEQYQAIDVTVLDEEPDVVMNDCEPVHVITARAATQALLDLEIFFQDRGEQFDAEWCAVHADEVRKVAEMLQKQTKVSSPASFGPPPVLLASLRLQSTRAFAEPLRLFHFSLPLSHPGCFHGWS